MKNRPWTHMDPALIPADLKEPAMDAGYPPDEFGIWMETEQAGGLTQSG